MYVNNHVFSIGSFHSLDKKLPSEKHSKLSEMLLNLLDENHVRADYRELVELALLVIGIRSHKGVCFKVKSPGN